ncbi:hypothetical protein PMAYCL1PPCAC_21412, partial [Pristionchus mayeri]
MPTTAPKCDYFLDDQSIAFVYQLNYGETARNTDIISKILGSDEVQQSGSSAFGALFPFPREDSYPPSQWILLTSPQLPIFFKIFNPPETATGVEIADGLQSVINNPGRNHQIVVIIANSDEGVLSAVGLASQLKESSTIITLGYGTRADGGDIDLSSLASSPHFTLTQSNEDPAQAVSLLLDAI